MQPHDNLSLGSPAQWQSPPLQFWNSPYGTTRASEWPDERSKKLWIGPFDMSRHTYAKKAREADWKEDEAICNNRKLAESLYDAGDFAGARYAWAQIADQYISEYQHTSRWAAAWDKKDALDHIARASVGCILNAFLAQYPDLCAAIKANNKSGSWSFKKPDPVLTAVADYEDDLTDCRALYILRVMLDFASDIEYAKDHSWMRSVYKRAFKAMGQMVGLDLSESIRLQQGLIRETVESERSLHWHGADWNGIVEGRSISWWPRSPEQREAYRTQSTQRWKDEVEELYLHMIADQRSLWGTMAEPTINSELELVGHYKSINDTEKAKAKARQLNILTKDNLGEDHDSTLRCMASLSTLLLDIGSMEEAGLVLYEYLTKYSRNMTGSTDTDTLRLELEEKFVTRRGWKEVIVLRERLEGLMSPFHFIWADYRLYTLRIGTVTFAPSYPADMEKDRVWTLASSPSRPDVDKYAFKAFERDHEFLDLQVPYIPYQHFVTTSAFEAGMPYLEYTKAAEDQSISSDIHEESATDTPIRLSEYFKLLESCERDSNTGDEDVDEIAKQERGRSNRTFDGADSKECAVVEFDEDPTTTQVQGFFNNIPGEAFVSSNLHVDIVSIQWAEYQHFALHKLPDNATEIEIEKGLFLPCHGYISGTWTDFKVCYQKKVHELFVVDASFLSTGANGGLPTFALRQETMQSSRYHEVTNVEKRAFCARLNPSFYRYKLVSLLRPAAVYKREMAKGTVTNKDEITLWDEMNAREKWDRDFETRKPTNDADRAILAQDLEAEDKRRNVWNEKHEKRSKSEKEPSSDTSMAVSGGAREKNVNAQSMPSSSESEENRKLEKNADGEGFIGKLKKIHLRGTRVEARTT